MISCVCSGAGTHGCDAVSEPAHHRIDVSFYDRSYTANRQVDMTYAASSDGGATWTSQRVSSKSFDPSQLGVPSGSGFRPFIGDYNGMISTAAGAAIAWT